MKRKILSALTVSFLFAGSVIAQTYTFTNAGSTGRYGPTQAQVNTEYTGTTLDGDVTINTQGVQEWTVPATGNYQIEVWGATAGEARASIDGLGRKMSGEINLTAGTVLSIVVGQKGTVTTQIAGGSNWKSGGGGASWVYSGVTPYIIAGGGGGAGENSTPSDAPFNASFISGYSHFSTNPIKVNTNIGYGGESGDSLMQLYAAGAGGAGWFSDGEESAYNRQGLYDGRGRTRINGFIGGTASNYNAHGGFGGGAAGTDNTGAGGGGGGYTGGPGGEGYLSSPSRWGAGGGGSCYYSGSFSNVQDLGTNSGHGQVVVSFLCNPTVITLDSVSLSDFTASCSFMPNYPTATTDCGTLNGIPDVSLPVTTPGTTTITWTWDIGGGNPVLTQTQDITIQDFVTGERDRIACGPVSINGTVYSSTQTVVDTLSGASAEGCDSIHTTNLTINGSYALGTVNQTECDSVILFGNMYYSSQVVYDTIVNGSFDGCDTITQVNLTIKNGFTTDIDYSTCASSYFVGGTTRTVDGVYTDTYTAQNGCDSIVNTTLTLNAAFTTYYESAKICSGESILLGGANQTTAGTYFDTIVSGGACDSVIVTILDVLTSPSTSISVTIADGESYTFAGTAYTASGTYTETYTAANGCDSTSSLVLTVTPADGVENHILDGLSLYPNPTNGMLFIDRESNEKIEVKVLDVTGKVLTTISTTETKISLDLNDYEKGLYLVTLKDQDRMITHRVIRN